MTILYNKNNLKIIRRKLRHSSTPAEKYLWKIIRSKKLDIKFRRQFSIDRFVVDFYCPRLKLALELDGGHHRKKEIKNYDRIRQKYLENLGIKIFRIENKEIFENSDLVISKIKQIIISS